jgi:hypothetical protein
MTMEEVREAMLVASTWKHLEIRKDKETASPLEQPERNDPANT